MTRTCLELGCTRDFCPLHLKDGRALFEVTWFFEGCNKGREEPLENAELERRFTRVMGYMGFKCEFSYSYEGDKVYAVRLPTPESR